MAIPKRRYPVQQPARQARVIVVHSRGLQETRSRLQIEVQALHASKIRKSIEECKLIGEVINTKVINFNLHDLKRRRSFDLHWMTTEGAVQFVKTIMEGIKDTIELITGRGVHSKNNEPRIKKR
uniref:Smr domain-containing protein n=1 Tax=Caenorhabditis tropicalis TaxID=1561998 RepID=A0A1I7TGN2_9PELO